MTSTRILGLMTVTTNAQLTEYLSDPREAATYPTEHDGRDHLRRLYSQDPQMNGCRPLDQINVIRAVARNFGGGIHGVDAIAAAVEKGDPTVFVGLPTPSYLFDKVWNILPDFVKSKVTKWAKVKMQGPIATEITSHVKHALSLLPIPIPAFFVNAVTNLVIPPLVSFMISKLGGTPNILATIHTSFTFPHHTANSMELMQDFDRMILLAAGLKPYDLPAHLKTASDNLVADANDDNFPMGQPDDRESRTDMDQFYQADTQNGSKSLHLTQVIASALRVDPEIDQDPDTFGGVVWKSLDAATKTRLRDSAKEKPPNKAAIADILYNSIHGILERNPYNVPSPILDTFTSMKTPEVTEHVIANQA